MFLIQWARAEPFLTSYFFTLTSYLKPQAVVHVPTGAVFWAQKREGVEALPCIQFVQRNGRSCRKFNLCEEMGSRLPLQTPLRKWASDSPAVIVESAENQRQLIISPVLLDKHRGIYVII